MWLPRHEDIDPRIIIMSLSIESKYRIFHIKRYLHLSSFSLCSLSVNATIVVSTITAILTDKNITKHLYGSRGKATEMPKNMLKPAQFKPGVNT